MEYPDLSYAKVLAVDDSPSILLTVKGLLGKWGITVHGVLSGRGAIKLISEGEPLFNAVFMDYLMPEMDGIETAMGIRSLDTEYAKTIPIIAMTAVGRKKMFLESGFQDYLQKPIAIATLGPLVERWVRDK